MVEVGRDLCGSSSPTLPLKQGHLQQAAQDCMVLCCKLRENHNTSKSAHIHTICMIKHKKVNQILNFDTLFLMYCTVLGILSRISLSLTTAWDSNMKRYLHLVKYFLLHLFIV